MFPVLDGDRKHSRICGDGVGKLHVSLAIKGTLPSTHDQHEKASHKKFQSPLSSERILHMD